MHSSDFFDLIEHPLEVCEEDTVSLVKSNNSLYTMRLSEKPYSKKVFAHKYKTRKVFLHIEVEESVSRIAGVSSGLYRFNMPADFYMPVSREVTDVYEIIYKGVISDSMDDLYKCAEYFEKEFYSDNKCFPFYPMPIITKVRLSDDNSFRDFTSKREKIRNAIIVRYGEEIPKSPKEDSLKLVESFTEESFSPLDFLREIFAKNPILRMSCIKKEYDMNVDILHKNKLTFNRFRSFVPSVAYFMNSGPWYKTWIKFGIDPRKDKSMYIYQVLELRVKEIYVQIFNNPAIMSELERDPDTFLTHRCSQKTGFLTRYGMALVKKLLKRESVVIKEDESMDFVVFD